MLFIFMCISFIPFPLNILLQCFSQHYSINFYPSTDIFKNKSIQTFFFVSYQMYFFILNLVNKLHNLFWFDNLLKQINSNDRFKNIIDWYMDLYDQAWQSIIRPLQIKTKISSYGPKKKTFHETTIIRNDVEFKNRNNKKICGFIFSSPDFTTEQTILYLHGNGGSKYQVLALVPYIAEYKMNLAAYDFVGCGNSDSDNLTYGVNEVFDIRDMLEQTRKHIKVGRVTLWGRSMGALCAIMFSDMYSYEVGALILDSPFRQLSHVIERVAERKVNLPSFLIKPILFFVKQKAIKQIEYDIFDINYLQVFKKINSNMPVLFIYSNFDSIVPGEQVLEFFNAYKGPKDLYEIYRTHDEDRPEDLFKQATLWILQKKRKNYEAYLQAREAQMLQNQVKSTETKKQFCTLK